MSHLHWLLRVFTFFRPFSVGLWRRLFGGGWSTHIVLHITEVNRTQAITDPLDTYYAYVIYHTNTTVALWTNQTFKSKTGFSISLPEYVDCVFKFSATSECLTNSGTSGILSYRRLNNKQSSQSALGTTAQIFWRIRGGLCCTLNINPITTLKINIQLMP